MNSSTALSGRASSVGRQSMSIGGSSSFRSGSNVMDPKRVFDAIELLELGEISTFNMSLSILLQKTSDGDAETVYLEKYDRMFPVLLRIMDGLNPLKGIFIQNLLSVIKKSGQTLPHENDEGNLMFAVDLLSTNKELETWPVHDLPCVDDEVFKNIVRSVDSNKFLLSILTIIRNVSFETNNSITLAYSTNLMVHLVSLIITMRTNGYICDACRLALDIVSNIGHRVDILGNKRTFYALHSADVAHHYATRGMPMKPVAGLQMPSLPPVDPISGSRVGVQRSCIDTVEDNYLYSASTKCLLAVLCSLLSSSERFFVTRSLDLLSQIALMSDNAPVFNSMPSATVREISDLFYANISATDPLRLFADGRFFDSKSLKLPPAAITFDFFHNMSDSELRDLVLESVHCFCTHAVSLRAQFGNVPDFISSLIRFIDSENASISTSSRRDITPQRMGVIRMATGLLSILASHPDNKEKFMMNQLQLCTMAFSDDSIAEILYLHNNMFQQPLLVPMVDTPIFDAVE